MSKCKILFLAANPAGTDRLSLDEESRAIEEKIRSTEHRDAFELVTKWAVRADDLLENFNRFKPHVVHFSGHGTEANEIILEDHSRKARPVSAAALKQLFTVLKDNIHVVVLNACFSQTQAEAIVQVIDCAIGMKTEIGDEAAIAFAASFYSAVGYGRSVHDAFEQGRTSLMLKGIPEEDTPTLLVRKGVNASTIFLVEEVGRRDRRPLENDQDSDADSDEEDSPTPPQLTLNELLPGTWQVQIQGPYGFTQMQMTLFPNGTYHGEQPTPMGMAIEDGQWQANPALRQFWFRGTRTAGFQVVPYEVMTQITASDVLWMTGMTSAGAQVHWQRLSPPPSVATPPPSRSRQKPVEKPPKLAGSSALKTWKQKLDWLQRQEAITADPAQKFALQKQIEEAEEKIEELEE